MALKRRGGPVVGGEYAGLAGFDLMLLAYTAEKKAGARANSRVCITRALRVTA